MLPRIRPDDHVKKWLARLPERTSWDSETCEELNRLLRLRMGRTERPLGLFAAEVAKLLGEADG
jgi:hypothetical protein